MRSGRHLYGLYADEIVIYSESREQVKESLVRWRYTLKKRGMRVSRTETEYMGVNERNPGVEVKLQGTEVVRGV